MRLLVDTNIVLDYLDERPSFFQSARKLMILGFLHELELWMSASQATDLFYLLTNGGRASEAGEVKKSMRQARQFIRICSLTESDVDAIITRNQKDFERSSIKVFDCDELFAYLEEEKGLAYDFIPL